MNKKPAVTFLIPKSSLTVHCDQKPNGNWAVKVVNTENFTEKVIDKDVSSGQLQSITSLLISSGSQHGFFGKNQKDIIASLKKHLKLLKQPYA